MKIDCNQNSNHQIIDFMNSMTQTIRSSEYSKRQKIKFHEIDRRCRMQ